MPARPKKNRKKSSFFVRAIRFGLVLLLVFGIYRLVVSWNLRAWKGDTRLTVAVATNPPLIASYEPQTGILTLIPLPVRLEISAAFGYGLFPVESLFELGSQKGLEGNLLAKSLEKEFGVPVDGWLDKNGLGLLGYRDIDEVGKGQADPLGKMGAYWQSFTLAGMRTSFSVFDMARIALSFGRAPLAKRQVIDPLNTKMVRVTKLADGIPGHVLVHAQVDAILGKRLKDGLIAKEQVAVAVFNTTSSPRIAGKVARIVNGMGARVISTKTQGEEIESCQVAVDSKFRESQTLQKILRIFNCSLRPISPESASQIEIFLGKREAVQFQD